MAVSVKYNVDMLEACSLVSLQRGHGDIRTGKAVGLECSFRCSDARIKRIVK